MAKKRKRARRGSAQIICIPNKFGLPSYAMRITDNGVRVYITLKASTPDAAAIESDEIRLRVKKGLSAITPVAALQPASTISALVEDFCSNYQSDEVWDIKSRRGELRSVLTKHLLPYLGSANPETLTIEQINGFKDALSAAGRSLSRKRRVLVDAQLMFSWALSRSKLRRLDNPWERVEKPTLESSTEFYTEDEVSALLAWCERQGKHELHAIIAFAFYTGCRRGEIAAVRWSDIDQQNAKIKIWRSWKREARKAGDVLTVNLHSHLAAILRAHRIRLGMLGDGLIFPSSKTDKDKQRTRMRSMNTLWGLDDARDSVNAEVKAKGQGTVVRTMEDPFHAFRHAHGTALAMRNASYPQIQAALGQKTESMARRYTHLAGEAAKPFVDALPNLGTVVVMPARQPVGSAATTSTVDESIGVERNAEDALG